MKYLIDHDYHIHSWLSSCSNDSEQTPQNILRYAEGNGFTSICLTDHFWDSNVRLEGNEWYRPQNYEHITKALPLPQSEKVKFYFGCETDFDKYMTVGISDKTIDKMDFIIIPTTHLHMLGFTLTKADCEPERRASLYVKRLDALFDKDLPFEKVGIAHLTCPLLAPEHWQTHIDVINMIPDITFCELFGRAAKKGAGIELNIPVFKYNDEQLEQILRPYRIASKCGCKFYMGSDAHHPSELSIAKAQFEVLVDKLNLSENQKYRFWGLK